jgi:hypothetical protein
MVEVRVPNLDCEGCASKLKKALFKLKGTFCIIIYLFIFSIKKLSLLISCGNEGWTWAKGTFFRDR